MDKYKGRAFASLGSVLNPKNLYLVAIKAEVYMACSVCIFFLCTSKNALR